MTEISNSRLHTQNINTAEPLNATANASSNAPVDAANVQAAHDVFDSAPASAADSASTTPLTPQPDLTPTQVSTNKASANAAAQDILNPPDYSLVLNQFTAEPIDIANVDALYTQTTTQEHSYTPADLQFADRAVMAKIHMQIAEKGNLDVTQQQQLYQALETIATSTQEQEVSAALAQIQDLPLSGEDYELINHLTQNKQEQMPKLAQAQAICAQSECTRAEHEFVQNSKQEFATELTQKPAFGKANLAIAAASLTAPPLRLSLGEHYPCLANDYEIAQFKDCLAKIEQQHVPFDTVWRDYSGLGNIGEALLIYAKEHQDEVQLQLLSLLASAKNPDTQQLNMSYPDFVNELDTLCAQHQAQIGSKKIEELRAEAEPLLQELKNAYIAQLSEQSATFTELKEKAGADAALTALQAAGNDLTQLERLASTYQGGVSEFIQDLTDLLASDSTGSGSGNSTSNSTSNTTFAQKLMQPVINNYITANQELRQLQNNAAGNGNASDAATVYQNNAQALQERDNSLNFIKHLSQLQPQNTKVQQALKASDGYALISNLIPALKSHGIDVDPNNLDSLMALGKRYFTEHPADLKFLKDCDLVFMRALKERYETDPAHANTQADDLSFYTALGLDQNTAQGFAKLDLSNYINTKQLKDATDALKGVNVATTFRPKDFFNFLLDVVEPGKQKMRAAINFHEQNILGTNSPVTAAQNKNVVRQNITQAIAQKLQDVTKRAADAEAAAAVELDVVKTKLANCMERATQKLLLEHLNDDEQKQFKQALQNIDDPSNKNTLLALYDKAFATITEGESENVPNLYLQNILARNAGDLSSSQLAEFELSREDAQALVAIGTANTTVNTASTTIEQRQLLEKIRLRLAIYSGNKNTLAYRALAYSYLQAQAKLNSTDITALAANNELELSAKDIKSLQDQFACSALSRLQAINNLKLPDGGRVNLNRTPSEANYKALADTAKAASKTPLSEAEAQQAIDNFVAQQQLFSDEVIENAEAILKLKNRKDEYKQAGDAIERIQGKIFTSAYVDVLKQRQKQKDALSTAAPSTPVGPMERASQQFTAAYTNYVEIAAKESKQQTISQAVQDAYQLQDEQAQLNLEVIDYAVNQLALDQGLESKEQLLNAIYAEGNFNRQAISTQSKYTTALLNALQELGYDKEKAIIYVRNYLSDSKTLKSMQDLRQQNLQRTIDFFSQNLNRTGRDQVSNMVFANAISDAYEDTVRELAAGERLSFSKTRGAELTIKISDADLTIGGAAEAEFAFEKTTDGKTVVSLSKSYLAELGVGVDINDNVSAEAGIQGSINNTVDFAFNSAEEAVNFFSHLVTSTLTDADQRRFAEINTNTGGRISVSAQAGVSVAKGNDYIEASAALEVSAEAGVSYDTHTEPNGVTHTFATDVTLTAEASLRVGKPEDEDEDEGDNSAGSTCPTDIALTIAQDAFEDKTDELKEQADDALKQNVSAPINDAMTATSAPISDTILQPEFTLTTEGVSFAVGAQYAVTNSISATHSHFDNFIQEVTRTKTLKSLSMPAFEDFCAQNHLTMQQRNALVAQMNELVHQGASITGLALKFALPPKHFAGEQYSAANTLHTAAQHVHDFELQGFTIEADFDQTEVSKEHNFSVLGGLKLYSTSTHGHSITMEGDFAA